MWIILPRSSSRAVDNYRKSCTVSLPEGIELPNFLILRRGTFYTESFTEAWIEPQIVSTAGRLPCCPSDSHVRPVMVCCWRPPGPHKVSRSGLGCVSQGGLPRHPGTPKKSHAALRRGSVAGDTRLPKCLMLSSGEGRFREAPDSQKVSCVLAAIAVPPRSDWESPKKAHLLSHERAAGGRTATPGGAPRPSVEMLRRYAGSNGFSKNPKFPHLWSPPVARRLPWLCLVESHKASCLQQRTFW